MLRFTAFFWLPHSSTTVISQVSLQAEAVLAVMVQVPTPTATPLPVTDATDGLLLVQVIL